MTDKDVLEAYQLIQKLIRSDKTAHHTIAKQLVERPDLEYEDLVHEVICRLMSEELPTIRCLSAFVGTFSLRKLQDLRKHYTTMSKGRGQCEVSLDSMLRDSGNNLSQIL